MTAAEDLRINGNEFFKKKDYASALDCYSKAIELNPNKDIRYYNNASAACLYLSDFEKAKQFAYEALNCSKVTDTPRDFVHKAKMRLGRAYLKLEQYGCARAILNSIPKDETTDESKALLQEVEAMIGPQVQNSSMRPPPSFSAKVPSNDPTPLTVPGSFAMMFSAGPEWQQWLLAQIEAGVIDPTDPNASTFRNRTSISTAEKVSRLLEVGGGLVECGNLESALRVYERVVALDPRNATAYLCRAQTGLSLKKLPSALHDARRALDCCTANGEFYYESLRVLAEILFHEERWSEARALLAASVGSLPSHLQQMLSQAQAKAAEHPRSSSDDLSELEEWLIVGSKDACIAGESLYREKEYLRALQCYTRAIMMHPLADASVLYHAAVASQDLGTCEDSLRYCAAAIQAASSGKILDEPVMVKATCLLIEELLKSVSMSDNSELRWERVSQAECLFFAIREKVPASESTMISLLEKHRHANTPPSLTLEQMMTCDFGHYLGYALPDYMQSYGIGSVHFARFGYKESPEAMYDQLFRARKWQDAVDTYTTALEKSRGKIGWQLIAYRALCYVQLKKLDEACSDLAMLMELLSPTEVPMLSAYASELLGECFVRAGRKDQCGRLYERALKLLTKAAPTRPVSSRLAEFFPSRRIPQQQQPEKPGATPSGAASGERLDKTKGSVKSRAKESSSVQADGGRVKNDGAAEEKEKRRAEERKREEELARQEREKKEKERKDREKKEKEERERKEREKREKERKEKEERERREKERKEKEEKERKDKEKRERQKEAEEAERRDREKARAKDDGQADGPKLNVEGWRWWDKIRAASGNTGSTATADETAKQGVKTLSGVRCAAPACKDPNINDLEEWVEACCNHGHLVCVHKSCWRALKRANQPLTCVRQSCNAEVRVRDAANVRLVTSDTSLALKEKDTAADNHVPVVQAPQYSAESGRWPTYCKYCNKSLPTYEHFESHIIGKKHLKKVARAVEAGESGLLLPEDRPPGHEDDTANAPPTTVSAAASEVDVTAPSSGNIENGGSPPETEVGSSAVSEVEEGEGDLIDGEDSVAEASEDGDAEVADALVLQRSKEKKTSKADQKPVNYGSSTKTELVCSLCNKEFSGSNASSNYIDHMSSRKHLQNVEKADMAAAAKERAEMEKLKASAAAKAASSPQAQQPQSQPQAKTARRTPIQIIPPQKKPQQHQQQPQPQQQASARPQSGQYAAQPQSSFPPQQFAHQQPQMQQQQYASQSHLQQQQYTSQAHLQQQQQQQQHKPQTALPQQSPPQHAQHSPYPLGRNVQQSGQYSVPYQPQPQPQHGFQVPPQQKLGPAHPGMQVRPGGSHPMPQGPSQAPQQPQQSGHAQQPGHRGAPTPYGTAPQQAPASQMYQQHSTAGHTVPQYYQGVESRQMGVPPGSGPAVQRSAPAHARGPPAAARQPASYGAYPAGPGPGQGPQYSQQPQYGAHPPQPTQQPFGSYTGPQYPQALYSSNAMAQMHPGGPAYGSIPPTTSLETDTNVPGYPPLPPVSDPDLSESEWPTLDAAVSSAKPAESRAKQPVDQLRAGSTVAVPAAPVSTQRPSAVGAPGSVLSRTSSFESGPQDTDTLLTMSSTGLMMPMQSARDSEDKSPSGRRGGAAVGFTMPSSSLGSQVSGKPGSEPRTRGPLFEGYGGGAASGAKSGAPDLLGSLYPYGAQSSKPGVEDGEDAEVPLYMRWGMSFFGGGSEDDAATAPSPTGSAAASQGAKAAPGGLPTSSFEPLVSSEKPLQPFASTGGMWSAFADDIGGDLESLGGGDDGDHGGFDTSSRGGSDVDLDAWGLPNPDPAPGTAWNQ
eukprot:Rmarinus@m.11141